MNDSLLTFLNDPSLISSLKSLLQIPDTEFFDFFKDV